MFRSTKRRKTLLVLGLFLSGLLATARVSWALDVGDKAPDFTLPSTTGEKISLSQFRGKKIVLLEFYGVDYSPV
jgi:AhpC/TSA family